MITKEIKRILLCTLAALMALLTLAGCGEQPEPPEEEEPTPGIHAPVEKDDPEPKETPEVSPSPSGEEELPPTQSPKPPVTLLDALYGSGDFFDAPPPVSYGTMNPTATQDERIAQIRAWFYKTEADTDQYEKRAYDDNSTAYWDDGKLVKLEIREVIDPALPDGTKYTYYYKEGNPYFTYVEDDAHQLRLYYWNAVMIRWIETDGVEHDSDNPAYEQYFANSWRLYQIVSTLG